MDHTIKKLGLLSLFTLLATRPSFAVDDMQMRNLENRVSALEQAKSNKGVVNPSARPVVKSGFDFWLQGEALFMQATEDNLNYSIITYDNREELFDTTPHGHVKNVTYDWSWGFRIGGGWNFQHDGWDILFNWTSYRTQETNREFAQPFPENANLILWAAELPSLNYAQWAQGIAKLRINLFDVELGREFFVSKWLTLRPFVGGRAAWIHRNLKVTYQGIVGQFSLDKDTIHLGNRFNGGGIRAGLGTQWSMGMGWSLYADAAFDLLYGSQHLHQHQVEVSNAGVITDRAHVDNTWSAVRSMVDLALGLRWDKLFYNNRYRIRLQAGWEQHVVLGFDKDMNFTDLGNVSGKFFMNSGDLGLSGVSFQARFDF